MLHGGFERQGVRPVAGEAQRLRLAVELDQHPAVHRLRRDDQAVGAGGVEAGEIEGARRRLDRPAVLVLHPAAEEDEQPFGAQLVGPRLRDGEAPHRRVADRQRPARRHLRPQLARVVHRQGGELEAEVAAALAGGAHRRLVVALAQVGLEEEVASHAAPLVAGQVRDGAGAQCRRRGEQAGRADLVERRLVRLHQEGPAGTLLQVEELRRPGAQHRELRQGGERRVRQRRQRRRAQEGERLQRDRGEDGLRQVVAQGQLMGTRLDGDFAERRNPVHRERQARAVLRLGAQDAGLRCGEGDLHLLPRLERDRQGPAQIDRPRTHHEARHHPGLGVHVQRVAVGGVEMDRREAHGAARRRRHRRLRQAHVSGGTDAHVRDPLLLRLQGEHVEPGVEIPHRGALLERRRLVAVRPGEQERLDLRARLDAVHGHPVAPGGLDLQEQRRRPQQVEAAVPGQQPAEGDRPRVHQPLAARVGVDGEQRRGVRGVDGGAGMDARHPVGTGQVVERLDVLALEVLQDVLLARRRGDREPELPDRQAVRQRSGLLGLLAALFLRVLFLFVLLLPTLLVRLLVVRLLARFRGDRAFLVRRPVCGRDLGGRRDGFLGDRGVVAAIEVGKLVAGAHPVQLEAGRERFG